jgi:hypothetical protein
MQRKMTRVVVPLAVAGAAAAAAAAAATAGTCAWSQSGPSPYEAKIASAGPRCSAGPATRPVDSAAPAPDSFGDGLDMTSSSPLRAGPALRVALTAHTHGVADDIVRYHITARSTQGDDLHGITVVAHLTCAPGQTRFIGRPVITTGRATTGRATTGRRTLTWRLDLDKASATATFAVRVHPGDRGGLVIGELTTMGPGSNCPAHRDPADPFCRAAVVVPPHPAPVAHPVTLAPAARPRQARPQPAKTPAAMSSVPAAALPAVAAPPALPVPTPSQSQVLSQVDRAPLVPADSTGSGEAASQDAPEVAPPDTVARSVLRSAEYSQDDLSGRAIAFLLGGVAFLLVAAVVAGRLVGMGLRGRGARTVKEK